MLLLDGYLKRFKIVQEEYSLWPNRCKFLTQYSIPSNSLGTIKLNLTCKYTSNASCYTHALLTSQPDFQAQKGELQETIEVAGYLVIFYLVYHCKLNFIEYFKG
ncbi:hypothetical protein L873DRAFT_1766763 [Choiromyces venosus 120613-1]|uniref:Uncharacterized protein n=1 Tax=Choiromyces venosus 120613-1 TaxID=1336337 RepID=A0A3N4K1S2_9PEZI|nr:hypothetical protein L873DRAFT_1766763 [Choiromyces venosus 120613-1]